MGSPEMQRQEIITVNEKKTSTKKQRQENKFNRNYREKIAN